MGSGSRSGSNRQPCCPRKRDGHTIPQPRRRGRASRSCPFEAAPPVPPWVQAKVPARIALEPRIVGLPREPTIAHRDAILVVLSAARRPEAIADRFQSRPRIEARDEALPSLPATVERVEVSPSLLSIAGRVGDSANRPPI